MHALAENVRGRESRPLCVCEFNRSFVIQWPMIRKYREPVRGPSNNWKLFPNLTKIDCDMLRLKGDETLPATLTYLRCWKVSIDCLAPLRSLNTLIATCGESRLLL